MDSQADTFMLNEDAMDLLRRGSTDQQSNFLNAYRVDDEGDNDFGEHEDWR